MDNPEDIDTDRDEEMKTKHTTVVNEVLVVATILAMVMAAEHIKTGEGIRALIGTTLVAVIALLAYWAGRSDERKNK